MVGLNAKLKKSQKTQRIYCAQYIQDPKRTPEHNLPKMATNPTNVTVDVGFVDLDLDLDLGSTSGSTIRSTSSEIFTDPSRGTSGPSGPSDPSDPSDPSPHAPNVRPARSHSSPCPHDPLEPRGHACRRAHDTTLGPPRPTATAGTAAREGRATQTRAARTTGSTARLSPRTRVANDRRSCMRIAILPTRSPAPVYLTEHKDLLWVGVN